MPKQVELIWPKSQYQTKVVADVLIDADGAMCLRFHGQDVWLLRQDDGYWYKANSIDPIDVYHFSTCALCQERVADGEPKSGELCITCAEGKE